jgi:hypothetical protein
MQVITLSNKKSSNKITPKLIPQKGIEQKHPYALIGNCIILRNNIGTQLNICFASA